MAISKIGEFIEKIRLYDKTNIKVREIEKGKIQLDVDASRTKNDIEDLVRGNLLDADDGELFMDAVDKEHEKAKARIDELKEAADKQKDVSIYESILNKELPDGRLHVREVGTLAHLPQQLVELRKKFSVALEKLDKNVSHYGEALEVARKRYEGVLINLTKQIKDKKKKIDELVASGAPRSEIDVVAMDIRWLEEDAKEIRKEMEDSREIGELTIIKFCQHALERVNSRFERLIRTFETKFRIYISKLGFRKALEEIKKAITPEAMGVGGEYNALQQIMESTTVSATLKSTFRELGARMEGMFGRAGIFPVWDESKIKEEAKEEVTRSIERLVAERDAQLAAQKVPDEVRKETVKKYKEELEKRMGMV